MSSSEIRKKFLDFFEKRGHVTVPSSSLVPDDPSVLLTTAGMQQFKKYFTGELDFAKDYPGKKGAASIQKSFRTSDIDEVGDETHLTFFEMLGNFSFGGYFKKEAIEYAHEFITKEMGLEISYVTIFGGSHGVPKDEESKRIWNSLGITDVREEGIKDVFWGPTGSSGPCGPTTEIYCKNAAGQDVEIWNIVFNEYMCDGSRDALLKGDAKLTPLETKGIDTGMGLERLAMIAQGKNNVFETDLFESIVDSLPQNIDIRTKRILVDHYRAVAFLIAEGLRPDKKRAGSVLRKLIGQIQYLRTKLDNQFDSAIPLKIVIEKYAPLYLELKDSETLKVFEEERRIFEEKISRAIPEMKRRLNLDKEKDLTDWGTKYITEKQIEGDIIVLHQSFGMPLEMIEDILTEYGVKFDKVLFKEIIDRKEKEHQETSRAGAEKKFGGHGLILNTGELKAATEEEVIIVTRLHTATHMLQQALRDVLGNEVKQMGSDITAERTRFDFTFSRKLTPEEIKKVEDRVNEKIKEDLPVAFVELPRAEAERTGALFFSASGGKAKYGDIVKVYYIGNTLDDAWSKEFCGGPHVSHTSEVGKFKIAKEEAVGAGVRRIRGIIQDE